MQVPKLHDAECTALTIAWAPVPNAIKYEVQMRDGPEEWTTLSSELTSTKMRKKNLQPEHAYCFRFRARDQIDWGEWSPPTEGLETLGAGTRQMAAPQLQCADGISMTVKWEAVPEATMYEVQYREENGAEWVTAHAALTGVAVRKKNLEAKKCVFVCGCRRAGGMVRRAFLATRLWGRCFTGCLEASAQWRMALH